MNACVFLIGFLCFTVYQCVEGQAVCGCAVRHPQVRYCDSDYAMMIEIHDKVESDYPYAEPDQYNKKEYARFNISVLEVFKPTGQEVSLVTEEFTELWTTIATFCGVPELQVLETYVISGDFDYVVDPDTGEEHQLLTIDRCDLNIKFDDVTNYQMRGLTGEYDRYCSDECESNQIFGEEVHTEIGEIDIQYVPVKALTKYWTLDVGCFYNPAASMHNLVDDCESKFSLCRIDEETHQCAWDLTSEFMECYKDRGLAVSWRLNSNAAAIRKPSDCKYLQNKKLKRQCLRKIKKAYKQRLNKEDF